MTKNSRNDMDSSGTERAVHFADAGRSASGQQPPEAGATAPQRRHRVSSIFTYVMQVEENDEAEVQSRRLCTCPYRRYYIALMLFLGYLLSYSTRVNLSVAILFMTARKVAAGNGTAETTREFNWDEKLQGYALSSFFYGYIVTQIPGGYLAGIIGGHRVLFIGVTASGLLTFVAPYAAIHSFVALIFVRVGCGLLQGLTIPAANAIWANWAPPLERTILSGFAIGGNFMSSLIVMPVCGVIGNNWGWEWMFYFFGIISCAWGIIWFLTVFSSPATDRFISNSERSYIERTVGYKTRLKPVHPWRRIFGSTAVWAVVVAHTGHNWGFYTVLLYGVKFFNETLGFPVQSSSFYTGLGFALCGCVIYFVSYISDVLRSKAHLSTVLVRKMFAVAGFILQAACMYILAYLYVEEVTISAVILAITLGGISWSGFYANPLDIATPHAAIILGLSNTFATLPGIVSPYIVGCIIPDENPKVADWLWVWVICSIFYLSAALFFIIFAKGEKQSWVYNPVADAV